VRVIGTAGHVDHGKSALVLALTGIDPDRLREEKERGLTIDLGFAWFTLPGGEPVGVIDVPGHRDFIENMLAGVGSIDATLFVVAADESVMPQTREHLAILDLLEIETGVVAITKTDLVDSDEWLDLVVEDVAETLAGTVLQDAPIVLTSAETGRGLDELLHVLEEVLSERRPHADRGRPRLPVDRVFCAVVTGTLIDGTFEVGQEVTIQPQGLTARIRGLQTHKEKIQQAVPGSRVAINLSGVGTEQLKRGDVVASGDWLQGTTLVDVQMRYLPEILWSDLGQLAQRPLRHNTRLKFYTGAAEVMGRVRLLGQDVLLPEQVGWVQLELQEPVAMVRGDHYIVRLPSPPTTVGGGTIVDPYPGRKHRRFRSRVVGSISTQFTMDLLEDAGLGDAAADTLTQLVEEGRILVLGREDDLTGQGVDQSLPDAAIVTSSEWWSSLIDRAASALASYHRRLPLRRGMPREALRSTLKLPSQTFEAAMARMESEGIVVDQAATVRLPSHTVELTPQQSERVDDLLSQFRRHPYGPPSVKDCVEMVGEEVFKLLIARRDLVQVSPDVVFLPETYDGMVSRIRSRIERQGSVTLAEVRDMFDSSRKYAQALLEHLDEARVTKRLGDKRILR